MITSPRFCKTFFTQFVFSNIAQLVAIDVLHYLSYKTSPKPFQGAERGAKVIFG